MSAVWFWGFRALDVVCVVWLTKAGADHWDAGRRANGFVRLFAAAAMFVLGVGVIWAREHPIRDSRIDCVVVPHRSTRCTTTAVGR